MDGISRMGNGGGGGGGGGGSIIGMEVEMDGV